MIVLKKQIQSKQSGMTAIMLAMFLAIVVSLLSIGFATLVRKDQAETLDKTLSYQAQYAAESGVNKAISFIDENPGAPGSDDCTSPAIIEHNFKTFDKSFKVGDADVTCALWTRPSDLKITVDNSSAQGASFTNSSSQPVKITWDTGFYAGHNNTSLPDPLDINNKILVATIAKPSDYKGIVRYYFVPSDQSGTVLTYPAWDSVNDWPISGDWSGSTALAKVDTVSGRATAQINGLNGDFLINLTLLNGNPADVIISGSGFVNTSQYEIDVNAKAQDITKRVKVRYNPTGSVGPNSLINIGSGGRICKDYMIDGDQLTAASDGTLNQCPEKE